VSTALFVWGGWDGHEPHRRVTRVAAALEPHGFRSEVVDSLEVLEDAERLSSVDVVVPCWTDGTITSKQVRGLMDAVARGTGLAGWHGGMGDAFRASPRFQFMVGGQWVAHPGGIVGYEVGIEDPDHPVTAGLDAFGVRSEQYFMQVDPANHVLASTTMDGRSFPWLEGCGMPVAWVRPWWAGRVFYCSLGHFAADFDVPDALELVVRGVRWAARELDPTGPDRTVARDAAAEAAIDDHW